MNPLVQSKHQSFYYQIEYQDVPYFGLTSYVVKMIRTNLFFAFQNTAIQMQVTLHFSMSI